MSPDEASPAVPPHDAGLALDERPAATTPPPPRRGPAWLVPVAIIALVALVALVGFALRHRAESRVNHVALADAPKGVTVAASRASTYRASHRYVGTLEPWVSASVGPQFVAAYVSTVLVRPGASVRRGEVVATLDCRDASARSSAIAAEARALEARGAALASQASRIQGLLDGGYVGANEVQMRTAESATQQAEVQATRARLVDTSLSVNDCVLRAPFDGDVGARLVDPGAFVRPGEAVVTVVDRSIVRLVVDVPETDFDAVAPGTPVQIHLLAIHGSLTAPIARRSPSADPGTRTVHAEIDLADAERRIPVNTTAELRIDVGAPADATEIPLTAANVRGERAEVFVVDRGVARRVRVRVLGEVRGDLFVDARVLPAGAQVVTEGRATLEDGDRVAAREASSEAGATADAQVPTAPGATNGATP